MQNQQNPNPEGKTAHPFAGIPLPVIVEIIVTLAVISVTLSIIALFNIVNKKETYNVNCEVPTIEVRCEQPTAIIAVATDTPAPTERSELSCLPQNTRRDIAKLLEVKDGDTILVDLYGESKYVRYIGMDTPEEAEGEVPAEFYSSEATQKNRELLVPGDVIVLIKDVNEVDDFDRLLRYVFAGDKFINYELVRQGYAEAHSYPPDISCQNVFIDSEIAARKELKGMWGTTPTTKTPTPIIEGGLIWNLMTTVEASSDTNIQSCDIAPIGKGITCKIPTAYCIYRPDVPEKPTFCNFTASNEDDFTALVWGQDWSDYDGKCIIVSGDITDYKGSLQMVLVARSQVKLCR